MRRLVASTALLALVACGGSTPTTPPPAGNQPASLAVQAGDAQQAEPGAAVTIKPAVIVKDASGLPVSGVTVSFAVDSGGGSLSGASATTGSNGIATVGGWTLGNAEGRNILRASVASLAPLKITATAVVGVGSIAPATIGAGGGSVTVTQAGPLNGFGLTFPAGAYSTPTTWTVSYRSSNSIPRTATINPVSPLIRITGSATTYAVKPLTLTIPATVPANTFPVIIMRDPATGAFEVLPTTDYDNGYVTGITRHLSPAFFLANSGTPRGSSRGAALLTGSYDMEVFVSALTRAQLDLDVTTPFQPGTDDWEFVNPSSYIDPDGICEGMVLTEMWYFSNQKQRGAPNLWQRFDLAAAVGPSNRAGIRWGSRVNLDQTLGAFETAMYESILAKKNIGVTSAQIRYDMLKAQLLVMQLPQLIVVQSEDRTAGHALLAYKTSGGGIYVVDPNVPGGTTRRIDFANGQFVPYLMTSRPGEPPLAMPYVSSLTTSAAVDFGRLADEWPAVLNGTIDADKYPASELRSHFGTMTDTIYVADTMTTWIECGACEGLPVTPPSLPEARPDHLGAFYMWSNPGGGQTWTPLAGGRGFSGITFDPASYPNQGDYRYGYAALGVTGETPAWLDWKVFIVRRLRTTITPAAPTGMITVPLKLKHQVTLSLLPASVRYRWDFGDGKPKVTVDNNPNVEHIYDAVGTYPITGEIIDLRNNQVIARATETATITLPHFIWVFQSVNTPTIVNPPGGIGSEHTDTLIQTMITGWMTTLHQTPSSGQVEVYVDGACKAAALNMPTTGGGLGPTKAYLGANCSDPDYVQSFTMGTLGSGTVNGSAVATDADPDAITLPGGSINATMTGPTLSGTIVWRVRYSTGIATYTFAFQAIQTLPVP